MQGRGRCPSTPPASHRALVPLTRARPPPRTVLGSPWPHLEGRIHTSELGQPGQEDLGEELGSWRGPRQEMKMERRVPRPKWLHEADTHRMRAGHLVWSQSPPA